MKIDASKAYDGQSAFRNGLHDGAVKMHHNLYREGRKDQFWWSVGHWLGGILGKERVETNAKRKTMSNPNFS